MNSLSTMYVKAQVVIGMTVLVGFFSISGALLFHLVPDSNRDLLKEMIEGLVPLMILVLQSFFQKHTTSGDDNGPTTTINTGTGTTVNHTAGGVSAQYPPVQPPTA